jgi:NTP pyrophosphatase (non-canonical NTP hydrolase)
MTLNQFQTSAVRSVNPGATYKDRMADYGLGVAGEAGEVADIIKKVVSYGKEMDTQKFKKELGDVLWYVAALAWVNGMTLEDVAVTNVNKLMARYPNGFEAERAKTHNGE